MTHLALPATGQPRLPAAPARSRAATPINPVLLHDDIVRPELSNDAILAGKRVPHSDHAAHDRHRTGSR